MWSCQSLLVSCPRRHPLPRSPYSPLRRAVNGSAPVHLSSWRTCTISIDTPINQFWPIVNVPSFNLTIQAGVPSQYLSPVCWTASVLGHLTSASALKTFLFWRSYPDLIIWHSELISHCGPRRGRLKMREWKNRHGRKCRGGKGGSGNIGTILQG